MNLISSVGLSLGATVALLASKELSPTLEVLPLNSTLSKVTIPRYDKNKKCVAYLKADLMEVLADGEPIGEEQPIMVDCTGIKLRMSPQDAAFGSVHVDMQRARYRVTPGVLTVQEKITANSSRFIINGEGGVFHLDSHRGFVFGPLDCKIYPEPIAEAHIMTPPTLALLASTSLILAEPQFNPPTQAELLQVERAALPKETSILAQESRTAQTLVQQEKVSQDADERLLAFTQSVDSQSLTLLIQNPPTPQAAPQPRPEIKDPDLTINCDGGCFFDGDENLLVLLRNVIVKDSSFTLKAKEELKVLFLSEPKAGKEEKPKEEKPEEGDLPDLKMSISGVKSLVASGGVNFSGVDEKGNPVEASADTAFYDDQNKVLILKGGKPSFWFQQGKLQVHQQAENANASLRVEFTKQGTIKANTSGDGWKTSVKGPLKQN